MKDTMKEKINYNASPEVLSHINGWLKWLGSERMYSTHTLDAYARDLSFFFKFWSNYLKSIPDLSDLQQIDVRTFREFLSRVSARSYSCPWRSSSATRRGSLPGHPVRPRRP